MNTRNRLTLASAALLVGAMTSACGGASGAPADATAKDFCKAQNSLLDDIKFDVNDPNAGMPDEKDMADAMHSWADRMEKVGTPKDISDDARSGFEKIVQQAKDVSADDMKPEDMNGLEDDLSKDDKADAEEYAKFATETCGSMMGEPDTSDMPDAPEMPPSEVPESEDPEADGSR